MIILSIISFIVDLVQIFTVSGAATINLIWSLLFGQLRICSLFL